MKKSVVAMISGTTLVVCGILTVAAEEPAKSNDAEASVAAGKTLFASYCAGCHGANAEGGSGVGEGDGAGKPPALRNGKWVHGSSREAIFKTVKEGIGPNYYMAPFSGTISDDEIRHIVDYLLSLPKDAKTK